MALLILKSLFECIYLVEIVAIEFLELKLQLLLLCGGGQGVPDEFIYESQILLTRLLIPIVTLILLQISSFDPLFDLTFARTFIAFLNVVLVRFQSIVVAFELQSIKNTSTAHAQIILKWQVHLLR